MRYKLQLQQSCRTVVVTRSYGDNDYSRRYCSSRPTCCCNPCCDRLCNGCSNSCSGYTVRRLHADIITPSEWLQWQMRARLVSRELKDKKWNSEHRQLVSGTFAVVCRKTATSCPQLIEPVQPLEIAAGLTPLHGTAARAIKRRAIELTSDALPLRQEVKGYYSLTLPGHSCAGGSSAKLLIYAYEYGAVLHQPDYARSLFSALV